jgi:antitoxin component YwqK of YwqJK toxin-antitoxin module
MIYCYPVVDSVYNGLSREWYENGQLKSEGNFDHGVYTGLWTSYHENGNVKMRTWHENGRVVKSETFHENGNMSSISEPTRNGRREKSWSIDGKLLIDSRHIRGYPIKCTAPLAKDTAEMRKNLQVCFCGDDRVFWKDSTYVDAAGKPVNPHYKTKYTHYYHSGKVRSKMISNQGHGWRKEWDEDGKLEKEENF